jgi:DNA gyrase inhibitor GyrI
MKRKSLFILILLFVPGLMFLNYIGVFTSIRIEESQMGPYHVVFKKQTGAYKFAGNTILEVKNALVNTGIALNNSFGIFYDDPKINKETTLKYDAGYIVPQNFKDTTGAGLQMQDLPRKKCLKVVYPNKNFLSIYSGIAKVYPKLFKKAQAMGYRKRPVMEIYESDNILYLMPLEK